MSFWPRMVGGPLCVSFLIAGVVSGMASLAGCGRTELLSRRRCSDAGICQIEIQVDGGRDGVVFPDGAGGSGGGDGRRPDASTDANRCPTGTAEICGDNRDNNCNGLIDCADPACYGDRSCFKPGQEVCNNGLDDDDDRLVDCADPDCRGNLACRPMMGMEICDNGIDDNADGLADCGDPQCKTFPACINLNCMADLDFGAVAAHGARVTRNFDTRGAPRGYATCAPAGGHGRVGRFTLTEPADVRVDFSQQQGTAHVVSLFRAGTAQACDVNAVGCMQVGDTLTATQTFAGLGAGTYWLIVESYPNTEGMSQVVLSTGTIMKPEVCGNGIDDDGNGLTDCQDLACRNDPGCAASTCMPDIALGALVVGATEKVVRSTLIGAPDRYRPTCAGTVPGGDLAISFTLPEASGIVVDFDQSGHTIFSLFRDPGPGLNCDASQLSCVFEEDPSNAIAFINHPAGRYLLILKATSSAEAGTLVLRISAFKNRGIEVCGNGIDDDANGLTDCDDPACFGIGMCNASVCMGDDIGPISPGTSRRVSVDTRIGRDVYQTSCGRGNGKERVLRMTLTAPMSLGISCTDSGSHVIDLAQQLAPLDSCTAHEVSCADPAVLPFGCGYAIPGLQPGQYNLIVEAFQSGSEGIVDLIISGQAETVREICDNGIDDDRDGATDCADLKCVTSALCEKFACHPDRSLGLLPLDDSMKSVVVETAGAGDDQTKTTCTSAPGGQDGVVDFQLPATAIVRIDWAQVGRHDFALYTDDGPLLSCEAGHLVGCFTSGGQATGFWTAVGLPGGRYHLVVDADAPGAEGGVVLQITARAAP